MIQFYFRKGSVQSIIIVLVGHNKLNNHVVFLAEMVQMWRGTMHGHFLTAMNGMQATQYDLESCMLISKIIWEDIQSILLSGSKSFFSNDCSYFSVHFACLRFSTLLVFQCHLCNNIENGMVKWVSNINKLMKQVSFFLSLDITLSPDEWSIYNKIVS